MNHQPGVRQKRLYRQLIDRWGEEATDIIVFDRPALPGVFRTMNVAIWDPKDECDVLSFVTLGMSEMRMAGADYRAELTLGCRARLTASERWSLAAPVANLTEYPFQYNLKIDWKERLSNPGRIPVFQGCTQLLLAPVFRDPPFRWFSP